MILDRVIAKARLQIPKLDGIVPRRRHDEFGPRLRRIDRPARPSSGRRLGPSSLDAPDLSAFQKHRPQRRGHEPHAADRVIVPPQRPHADEIVLDVPNFDAQIGRTTDQVPPSLGAEIDARHDVGVPSQRPQVIAALVIPQLDRPVFRPRRGEGVNGMERQGGDARRMGLEGVLRRRTGEHPSLSYSSRGRRGIERGGRGAGGEAGAVGVDSLVGGYLAFEFEDSFLETGDGGPFLFEDGGGGRGGRFSGGCAVRIGWFVVVSIGFGVVGGGIGRTGFRVGLGQCFRRGGEGGSSRQEVFVNSGVEVGALLVR
mmetsp:Transcript_27924/g.58667  ORF Transcript_27924/g.58667 Transcript_27924/m.58667 type:complete len:313 (+) Transcript_27924:924-1862(+)